jgi:hypothetical protein
MLLKLFMILIKSGRERNLDWLSECGAIDL